MTLSFSTHWPEKMGAEYAGKPNHFVEKILAGFQQDVTENIAEYIYESGLRLDYMYADDILNAIDEEQNPKLHTFRHDSKDRWEVGMKIHPVITNRTPQRFQFAPVMEVKGIQKIYIEPNAETFRVKINKHFLSDSEIETLAINDGFPNAEAFFLWFSETFTGKIIHWTDLKY